MKTTPLRQGVVLALFASLVVAPLLAPAQSPSPELVPAATASPEPAAPVMASPVPAKPAAADSDSGEPPEAPRPTPWAHPVPSQAPPPLPAPVTLDSKDGHNGAFVWQMAKQEDVKTDGAAISQPDFADAKDWLKAVIPGTVLNSLVYNKVYPEPYFGTNNEANRRLIPDISEAGRPFYTYWFRTNFEIPADYAGRDRRVILQMDGINYRAEVWVNGQKAGGIDGMFMRGFFDITAIARPGADNALAVLVQPVDVSGSFRHVKNAPDAPLEGHNGGDGKIGANTTMLMTAGWDFTIPDGVRDRNTGIWKSVKIYSTGPVDLRGAFVKTHLPLPETNLASETVSVEAVNLTDSPQEGTIRLRIPAGGVLIEKKVTLAAHAHEDVTFTPEEFSALNIENPKLWWPFSKGEPYLYKMRAEFVGAGAAVSKAIDARFGIREVTSDQNTPDQSRLFYVNGQRFFVHGSNWVPEAMLRTSADRTNAELRYTRQAGIDFLRLWGGGIMESEEFFDKCDELGILVWVEFWQTANTVLPTDADLYRANTADTVRRIRIHPSLAYYVSANEREKVVPIKDLLDQLDGTRGYQVQSETAGVHDGSPYQYVNPMRYYDDTASDRGSRINGFCPEYGAPCLPTISSLREMMDAKDLWPINKPVWDYLDGGGFHKMTTAYDKAVRQYGEPKDIEDYAWKAQMVGAVSYRGIWESWNRTRLDYGDRFCSGVLFWYQNSPEPQVASRFYDYYLEPTAGLYATQNALQPLHAQFDFIRNTVSVNNQRLQPFRDGRLLVRVIDSHSKEVFKQSVVVNVGEDAVANDVLKVDFPSDVTPVHFIRLDLYDGTGRKLADTFYWRSTSVYDKPKSDSGPLYAGFEEIEKLPPADVEMLASPVSIATDGEHRTSVKLRNTTGSLAFFIQVKLVRKTDGQSVRPTFYSDNFISLLPGEQREIQLAFSPASADDGPLNLVLHGTNIPDVTLQLPTK